MQNIVRNRIRLNGAALRNSTKLGIVLKYSRNVRTPPTSASNATSWLVSDETLGSMKDGRANSPATNNARTPALIARFNTFLCPFGRASMVFCHVLFRPLMPIIHGLPRY